MLLVPFQYNYVDFKFFPAMDAGAEVKVFVREFSVLGPDAPVTIAGGNSDSTVAGSYEDHLISGLDAPQAPELLPGVIYDVLVVPGGDVWLPIIYPSSGYCSRIVALALAIIVVSSFALLLPSA